MKTLYLQPNDPWALKIASVCFPDYKGKTFAAVVKEPGMNLNSYWDGGSRDYYAILNLKEMKKMDVPQNGTMFDKHSFSTAQVPMPNVAVVRHSIVQGKDTGITIYLHPDNGDLALPRIAELSWVDKVVLIATRSLKSSYQGQSNYRFHEAHRVTGINSDEWEAAKGDLIKRGLLNKAGALTVDGKNAVSGMWSIHELRGKRNG